MDPALLAAIEALIRQVEARDNPTPEQLVTLRARLITAALTGDTATLSTVFQAAGVQMPTAPFIGPAVIPGSTGSEQYPVGFNPSGYMPLELAPPPPPKPPGPAPRGTEWLGPYPDGTWDLWTTGMMEEYDKKTGKPTGRLIQSSEGPKFLRTYKDPEDASTVNARDFSAAIQDKLFWAQKLRAAGDVAGAARFEAQAAALAEEAGGTGGTTGYSGNELKNLAYALQSGQITQAQYDARVNALLLGDEAGDGGMTAYQAGQLDISRQRLGLDLTAEQRQRQETAIAAARSGEPLTYLSMLRGGAAPTQGGTETYEGFPRLVPPAVAPESIGMVSPNPVAPTSASGGAGPYSDLLTAAEQKYGLPAGLLALLMGAESSGNRTAVSPKGAAGLLQLMPDTAEELGVADRFDPIQNIDAGARYLRQMYDQFGNWSTALAAYNAGPGNVSKGIIPAETQAYVKRITGALEPGDFMGNIQQGQAALAAQPRPTALRLPSATSPYRATTTAAWQPPPAPGYMTDIQAGRAIKPAGILPGLTPPGPQAQANMTPYERAALRERVGFQGQSEMDWDALLEGIRRSMGPGLAAASYGGRLRAPA